MAKYTTLEEHVRDNYSPDMETVDPPYGEVFIWTVQDYLSSCDATEADIAFLKKHGLLDLLDEE